MEKEIIEKEIMDCDIIGDLLPSYLDGICSKRTKQYVEQHLESCEFCKKKAELLKNTDFSVKKLEQNEIDAVKKVKGHIRNISVVIYSMIWAVIFLGLMIIADRHSSGLLMNLYDFVLPVAMLSTYFLTLLQTEKRKIEKLDIAVGVFSVLIDIYAGFLIHYSLTKFRSGGLPFGIKEASSLGIVISTQLKIAVVIQLLLLAWILFKTIKKGFISSILPNIYLFGAAYIMSVNTWLSMLDSAYYFSSMFRTTRYIFIIGIVGTVLISFFDRIRWKYKEKEF